MLARWLPLWGLMTLLSCGAAEMRGTAQSLEITPATGPCPSAPRIVGRLLDEDLDEVSGIVASRRTPGVFFVHNDSGDSPRFFAIDRRGITLAQFELAGVPKLLDAEDIATGPGADGTAFVYIGDTGNNFASMGLGIPRRKAVLYRVAEPALPSPPRSREVRLNDAFRIVLTFPEGPRDVEAFFVDPVRGDLVMISKRPDGYSQLLTASADQLAGGGGPLLLAGELRFGHGALAGSPMPTAADISPDGASILVRTYSSVFLFRRESGEPAVAALLRAPQQLTAPDEPQAEAIAFAEQGAAYLTLSEGVRVPIYCAAVPNR